MAETYKRVGCKQCLLGLGVVASIAACSGVDLGSETIGQTEEALVLEQTLFPPDLNVALRFGHDLELDGNTLVVADRGYKPSNPFQTCGSIDDGAVHIYKRSSPLSPWSSTPDQTFIATTREGHFGEHSFLRGNTLVVAEPRRNNAVPDRVGAFNYYARPNANSPFTLVDTEFRPPNKFSDYTDPGLASNGTYVAAVAFGPEPNIFVYKLTPSGADLLYSVSHQQTQSLNPFDNIAITENNILVTVQRGINAISLYRLTDSGATVLDSSALTLANPQLEINNQYLGFLGLDRNEVVLPAQRQSAVPPGNIAYYLVVFNLDNNSVQNLRRIPIPAAYTSLSDHAPATNGLAIKDKDALFVNIAESGATPGPMTTLMYRYFQGTNSYNYAGNVNMIDVNPAAGLGDHINYGKAVAYDGRTLLVADTHDTTNIAAVPQGCSVPQGSVRSFLINPNVSASTAGSVKFRDLFPGPSAAFGTSVALDGDYALVGAPGDGDLGASSGSATLYRNFNGTWQQADKFVDLLLQGGDPSRAGTSVDMGSDFFVIGMPVSNSDMGSVLVSRKADRDFLRILTASPPSPALAEFGYDVAISGNTLVVGEPGQSTNNSPGAIYVFDWNGQVWSLPQKITPGDGAAGDRFGHAVDIQGEHIFVGAPNDDNAEGTDAGAVYLYRKVGATISFVQKLTVGFQGNDTRFGSAVSVSSTRAVVGGPGHSAGQGSAYTLRLSGTNWVAESGTNPLLGSAGAAFGSAVAVEDTNLLVGAPAASSGLGSVTRYQHFNNQWNQIVSMSGASAGQLGASVSISGAFALLGSPGEPFSSGAANYSASGAAYWINMFNMGGNFTPESAEALNNGPLFVCPGQQGVAYTATPVTGATSYNWWSPGATGITFNQNTATINFGTWFTTTTVNMDVNLNVAPYFIRKTITVTALDCSP